MVVDYQGHPPMGEPGKGLAQLRNLQADCQLWRAVRYYDETLIGDVLTVLHHPANSLDDKALPTFTHVCGEEAQQFAHQHLGVSPMVDDWRCEGLRCSYNLGHWARGVLVFRRDDSGQPKLWVIGDDFDGDFDGDGPPLLEEAIRRAKRHTCP